MLLEYNFCIMRKRQAILAAIGFLATVGILVGQSAPSSTLEQGVSKSHVGQNRQQQDNSQNDDQNATKSPSVIVQISAPQSDNANADHSENLKIERDNIRIQWFLAGFTGLLVVVGFLQARLLRTHAGHLENLAISANANSEATRRQDEHMIASERAWVEVSKVALTSGSTDHPQGTGQVFVSCGCMNHGKTPARVLGLNVLLKQGPLNRPEETWDES